MRVSIITGGRSGIGAAVARRLTASDQCLMLHGQGTNEVAAMVAFLLSPEAGHITGALLPVDGGLTLT